MKRLIAITSLLSLTTACSLTGSNPIEGIWVFYVSPELEISTDATCTENFNDLSCPSGTGGTGESPWTYSSTLEQDEDAFVAQIVGGSENEALLFARGVVWEGKKNEAGDWIFTFEDFRDYSRDESHNSGYSYKVEGFEGDRLVLKLTRDGNTFSGELTQQVTNNQSWTETDLWDSDQVLRYDGEIPSDYYLVDEDGYTGYSNTDDESDCSDSSCTLTIESDMQLSVPVTGELTDVKDPSDFDALEGYGDYSWDFGDTGF